MPSLRDIGFLFRTARGNFLLTPQDKNHWVNPLGVIVTPEIGQAFAFQFSPETVAGNSEDQFADRYAEICLDLMRRLKDPGVAQIDAENPNYFQYFPQAILLHHSEEEIILETPNVLFAKQAEILRKLGVKVRGFKIDKNTDIVKKLKDFEIVQGFQED